MTNPLTYHASRILHPGSRILHPGSRILHPGSRILHPASRILHPGSRILHLASCILIAVCTLTATLPASAQSLSAPKLPSSWSIVASYTIPGKASGLAWDGTYIYFGMYWSNGNQVYKFDPSSGTYSLQCTGNFSESFGLTYKAPNLANIVQPSGSAPAQINEFNLSGTTVSTITLPDHYMSGVAFDGSGYWVCTYYPDPGKVYHIDASGAVLSQFTPPNTQPWDICIQGSDLWIADYYGNMLYKVTSSGSLIESHASQGTAPSGVVYDGTYLWYCDGALGGNSTLYKIDLNGSGTPAITVPVTSHNYGTVTVGGSSTWNCQVQNTGSANLVISSIGIPGGIPISTTFSTPATITPGSSASIPLTYAPTTNGSLNTQVSINSNDPIHPSVDLILTGNAVIAGPHINITTTSHDWQERRKNAYSRWILTVGNNGDQPVVISALNMSDPHFIVDQNTSLPITIQPLQTAMIGLWFHPSGAGAFTGTLGIISNDPTQSPFNISLSGTGIDTVYPMGTTLWTFTISAGFDNSPKAICSVPDITGDSVPEVVIGSEDYYIRCFNGNASVTGDVLWATLIPSGPVYCQNTIAVTGDIDNDGYADIIVGTTGGSCSVIALSGKTGAQLWKHDTHEYGGGGWLYQVDTKYDYNNDGFPDVLAAAGDDGNNTGPHRAYCLNGKTGATIWSRSTEGACFSVIGVEDFTGDGQPDVVAGATSASQANGRVFGLDGVNGSIKWTFYPNGSSTWALLQIDDVTGDGIKDVASGDFSGHIYFHNAVSGAQVKSLSVGTDIILRFQDMGDVNADGHPDFLVAHSGPKGIMVNGFLGTFLWQKTLSDQSWNVTNMGDVNWDGVNDAGIGTLYNDNQSYFMNGKNGDIFESNPAPGAVDALSSIPDIIGDKSRELMVGCRDGEVFCLSGGFDSTTTGIRDTGSGMQDFTAKVYPNPCRDYFTVSFKLSQQSDIKISISDLAGRILYSQLTADVGAGKHDILINRAYAGLLTGHKGVGIIQIESDSGVYHQKLLFY